MHEINDTEPHINGNKNFVNMPATFPWLVLNNIISSKPKLLMNEVVGVVYGFRERESVRAESRNGRD